MSECPGNCKPRCATCVRAHSRARQRAYRFNKAAKERPKADDEAVSRGERVAYLGEDCSSSMPVDEGSWFEKPWSLTEQVSAQSRTGLIDALAEKMTLHVESPNRYLSDVLAGSETEIAIRRQIKGCPLVFHGSYVEHDDVPDPAKKKEAVKQLAQSIFRTFADDENEEGQKAGFYRFRSVGCGPPEHAVETINKISLYYGCCQDQKIPVPGSSSSRRHSHHQSDTPRPSSPAPSSPAPSSPPPSSPTPHLPSSTSLRLKPFRERSGRRGMDRFECQSHMSVSYNERDRRFTVRIKHGIPHVTYQRKRM